MKYAMNRLMAVVVLILIPLLSIASQAIGQDVEDEKMGASSSTSQESTEIDQELNQIDQDLEEFDQVLEEIVVTARKRQETLQDTPVAISAMSGDTLKELGIQSSRDLQQSVPGLIFSEQATKSASIFIRGVGQKESNAALDPGVGVYINGIYIPRTDSQLLDTLDTESIQVLRGPQGTLFGKNNTGGALLVTTIQPHTEGVEGYISGKIGNYGRKDVKVGGNIPLNDDSLAMRFSAASVKSDGYIENITDGKDYADEERLAATARIYWQATDVFSVDTLLYWSKQTERGAAFNCHYQYNDDASFAILAMPNSLNSNRHSFQKACEESEALAKDHKVSMNGPSVFELTSAIAALTLTWEYDDFEIKSISAWSGQDDIIGEEDQDGTSLHALSNGTLAQTNALSASAANNYFGGAQSTDIVTAANDSNFAPGTVIPRTPWSMPDDEEREQISQEIQLIGSAFDERLSFTVGAFAAKETMTDNVFAQTIGENGYSVGTQVGVNVLVPKYLGSHSDFDNETYAVFAQGTFDINDWLQLTLGGRYTEETREREATVYQEDCEEAAVMTGTNDVLCGVTGTPIIASQDDADAILDNPPSWLPVRLAEYNSSIINDNYVEGKDDPADEYKSVYLPGGKLSGKKTFSKFTPTVTLAANLPEQWLGDGFVDSTLLYFTYSKGFKGGGFEMRGLEIKQFEPEVVDNYELGLKLDAWDNRLRFNTAVYHMKYDDIQLRIAEQGRGLADIFLYISNAGEATIEGIETELTVLPMDNFTLTATFSLTDASFDTFDAFEKGTNADDDRSDEDFSGVPKTTYSVAAMYEWYTDIGLLVPRLSLYYRDEIFTGIDGAAWDPEHRDRSTLEDMTLWNFRLSYFPNEQATFALFVNNLADEHYFQGGFSPVDSTGATMAVLGAPRTYGLEASYNF